MPVEANDIVRRLRAAADELPELAFTASEHGRYEQAEAYREYASIMEAARVEIVKLRQGLVPFANFGTREVDEHGWKNWPMRDRLVDWFGPTDFRRARDLIATPSE
jgi:hypothetical protein